MRSLSLPLVVALAVAGCQSQNGGGGSTQPGSQRPQSSESNPLRPISQSNTPARSSWKPDWWFNTASRTSSGTVQACGSATSDTLKDARRQAIDEARLRAVKLAGEGLSERVIQSASNPNTQGGFTVWVVIELGGQ